MMQAIFLSARRVVSIARVTAAGLFRQPAAWVLLLAAALWLASAGFWSQLSQVEQAIFARDFFFEGLTLAATVLAIALTAPLLAEEKQRRTLELMFARPVRAWEFFMGKLAGVALVLAQAVLILLLVWMVFGDVPSSIAPVSSSPFSSLQQSADAFCLSEGGGCVLCGSMGRAAAVAWAKGVTIAAGVLVLAAISSSLVFVLTATALGYGAAHLFPIARQAWSSADAATWQQGLVWMCGALLPNLGAFDWPADAHAAALQVGYALLYAMLAIVAASFIFSFRERG